MLWPALIAAAVAAVTYLVVFVFAPGGHNVTHALFAIPAGLLTGAAQVLLLRHWLRDPIRELARIARLAQRADELGRRLAERSARPHPLPVPGEVPVDRAISGEIPRPGRRRAPGLVSPGGSADGADRPAPSDRPVPADRPVLAEQPEAPERLEKSGGRPRGSGSREDPGRQLAGVITQLLSALDAEQSYRSIVDATGDVVLLVDSLGQIALASDSVQQILGFPSAELVSQPLARYVHTGDLEHLLDLLENFDARPGTDRRRQRPRLRLRAADGSWLVLEWVLSRGPAGHPGTTLLTGRDVTEQVALQEELVHQTQHDALTGLPNRIALVARLAALVATASAERPVAVLMIDLDRFKLINDSLGHACGDALLTQVGARLRDVLRPGDLIARLGGDEFAVVIQTSGLDGAELVAGRLASQLEDPFLVDGARLQVEASIGIAITHGVPRIAPADSATLLSEADIAMYRAKESGCTIAAFEMERDQAKSQRLEVSEELRQAIAHGDLVLHYHPIMDIRNTRVAGLEALVRWQHPERGLLPPSEFLPIADETGLIGRLSLAVLDQALAQMSQWAGQGWLLPISVNLSPTWLHQADVALEVAHLLDQHQVPARLLRLEITEAAVLVDPQQSLARLHRLKEMGVHLSLDDFGTGFSSMTHLRTLPIDQLKVDRSFVSAMVTSETDAIIVRAAIELGQNLGLSVVAEGIEDPDTLARVMMSGCSLAQGFYFAHPMPPEQVLDWIQPRFPSTMSTLAAEAAQPAQ